MIKKEFFVALEDLEKEKGIPQQTFIEALENALVFAYKKHTGESSGITVKLNPEKKTVRFFSTGADACGTALRLVGRAFCGAAAPRASVVAVEVLCLGFDAFCTEILRGDGLAPVEAEAERAVTALRRVLLVGVEYELMGLRWGAREAPPLDARGALADETRRAPRPPARRNVGFEALEPEEFDFRLEFNAVYLPNLLMDVLDDCYDICCGSSTRVDDKVTVNRRDLGTSHGKTLQSTVLNHFSHTIARRILEHRAAGGAPDGLRATSP